MREGESGLVDLQCRECRATFQRSKEHEGRDQPVCHDCFLVMMTGRRDALRLVTGHKDFDWAVLVFDDIESHMAYLLQLRTGGRVMRERVEFERAYLS